MSENKNTGLDELRSQIDAMDSELINLLGRRFELCVAVGRTKQTSGGPVLRPGREQAIVERLDALSARLGTPMKPEHIAAIWREIFSVSRSLQESPAVAFLGPEGTFSHQAVLQCLGDQIRLVPCPNLAEVFLKVQSGECPLGMTPLENSLQGGVGQSCDLFLEYNVHIVGEHISRISHCLMGSPNMLGKNGLLPETIQLVTSHSQPLAQCGGWLRNHLPMVPLETASSTSAAARRAQNEPGVAALGHESLARSLGLTILARAVEDQPNNWTRFALLAPGQFQASEKNVPIKSSLLFNVKDEPGALAHILSLLADGGVNLEKLESRPWRGQPMSESSGWKYVFFADTSCDLSLPAYAPMLEKLREKCLFFRLLGCYSPARGIMG